MRDIGWRRVGSTMPRVRHPGIVATGIISSALLITALSILFVLVDRLDSTVNGVVADSIFLLWLSCAIVAATAQLYYFYFHLDTNHPPDRRGQLYDLLGLPNAVPLARGGLLAGLAGFIPVMIQPAVVWIPSVLYGTASALDYVDGLTAKVVDRRSVLGEKLDMAFDSFGLAVAPTVAILWKQLPVWYLIIGIARYLFVGVISYREFRDRPVYRLPPSRVRRPLAGVQMVFITLSLSPLTTLGQIRAIAVVVLLPSLIIFIRDYLVVTGRRSA